MKSITITSSHHRNEKRKFVIDINDNKNTIYYFENEQRRKISTLAEYLNLLFEMFGVIEDLHIDGGTYAEVYNAIYDIKIASKYVFIYQGYAHLHEKPEFLKIANYYDFVAKFGLVPHEMEMKTYSEQRGVDYDFGTRKYFGYPDGIIFHIKDIGVFENNHFIEVYYE